MEIKKNYNLSETPWYFGAYLNMARHNVYLLIDHLTQKFSYLKYERIKDDELINNGKHLLANIFDINQKINDEERFKVYKYIVKRHCLPFIKIFHEKKGQKLDVNPIVCYEELHEFINSSLQLLTELRNAYSHYLAIDDKGKQIGSRIQHIDSKMKDTLNILFKHAPEFSLKRFEKTQGVGDYNHLDLYHLFEEGTTKFTGQGFYFFINLFLERSYAIKFLKKISGFKNETSPQFRATIQTFTTYSLKVPEVRLDNDDRKFSLLLEMLNELQRCPKELYSHIKEEDKKKFEPSFEDAERSNILLNSTDYQNVTDQDIDSLLAEITRLKRNSNRFAYFALRFIDEFNLLPNIRFQVMLGKLHLDNYQKKIIDVKINRRITKTINVFGKLSDFERNEEESLLALKKGSEGDSKVYFEQYAPHYNIENYKIPFFLFGDKDEKLKYPRPLINEGKHDHNNPTGFISLNDLPKLVLLAYYQPSEVERTITWFIKKNQHIILDGPQLERIKDKLSLVPEQLTRRFVDERILRDEDGKVVFLNKKIEATLLKKYRLSKENLLNLPSNELNKKIKNRKDKEYADQTKYISYLQHRRQELQRNLPDGVLVNQLPTRVINHLLHISEPNGQKVIHQKIKSIKGDCKLKLKRLKKELEKEKGAQNLKLGELATFLARDIIDMVIDKEVKQKITSPYYNKLQNKIAYFGISKNELIELCNELHLFDKSKGHVFLSEELINEAAGVTEFYKNYLNSKINWIEDNLFIRGKTGGYVIPENKKIPLSYSKITNDIKNKDFGNWLTNKSRMPVELPRTLFDKAIEQQLAQHLQREQKTFNTSDKFSVRLSKLLSGDTQPFYKFTRVYKYEDENVEFNIANLDGKTLKAKYGKYVEDNEKAIRFIQTQDRILKLLCGRILLESESGINGHFDLASFLPFSDNSPLNSQARFKQHIVRKKDGNCFTIIAEDNELQITEIENYRQLTAAQEKIEFKGQKGYEWTWKDFGRFKKMVADRRIPNLSAYFENKEITFDFLVYQLNEYDKYREKIFELTFSLEQEISTRSFEEIKNIELDHRKESEKNSNGKNFNEVQFSRFITWIENKNILATNEKEQLNMIRNRFSHSEFPDYYSLISKLTKGANDNFERGKRKQGELENLNLSISKKIFEMYKEIIQKVSQNLP